MLYNVITIDNQFEQGTFCVNECQMGFQPMSRVCETSVQGVGRSKSH